jgi:hypothetical protein
VFAIPLLALCLSADPPPPPATEAIAKAIRDLGAPKFEDRERAMRWLWSAGAAAEPALREALRSSDAEVVVRARDLLDKIPFGITPDSPRRFVELIAMARAKSSEWKEVVPKLLDLGPRGLEIGEKLADHLGADPTECAARRSVLYSEAWRITPNLIAQGDMGRVEEILERSALGAALDSDPRAVRHYGAWLSLRGKLAETLPKWRERAAKDEKAVVITYQLARLAGERDLERAMAEKIGRDDVREAAYLDAGAWAELANLPVPTGQLDTAALAGLRLIYQQLANLDDAATTLDELKKLPLQSRGGYVPPLVFRALMFAHRTDEAEAAIASAVLPDIQLLKFELLCQRHRYSEAMALYDQKVNERATMRWHWHSARLRVFHVLGDAKRYREALDQLPSALVDTSESSAVQELIEQLVVLGRTEDALGPAAAAIGYSTTPTVIFEKLYPKTPLAAETWWRILRLQHPTESPRETLDRLPALLDRRLAAPEGKQILTSAIALARERSGSEGERWLQGLGEACQAAGLVDQARQLTDEDARRVDSVAGWLKLGDLLAEQRRFAEAAAAFESAWRKDERQPLPAWLFGWAKERAGDASGKDFRERAHALTLGDEESRALFAEELVKRSWLGPEFGDAARRERKLSLALGKPDSQKGRNSNGALSSDPLARSDRLEAANDTQRFLIRMLRTNAYFKKHESYLFALHRLDVNRARGLLAKGEVAEALKAAETAQALLPGHAAPAEFLVPVLEQRGQKAEADRLYRAPADVLDKLCSDYPQSAAFKNSRAWLAVRCRRDLPLAIDLAKKAVALSPGTATYHETLAEACFQAADKAGALAAIGTAIELDPRSRYFTLQKVRMEAGDAKAPLPEGR